MTNPAIQGMVMYMSRATVFLILVEYVSSGVPSTAMEENQGNTAVTSGSTTSPSGRFHKRLE